MSVERNPNNLEIVELFLRNYDTVHILVFFDVILTLAVLASDFFLEFNFTLLFDSVGKTFLFEFV